ncbi:MAG: chloride channel protein, partial [Planctomycetota bacterium]
MSTSPGHPSVAPEAPPAQAAGRLQRAALRLFARLGMTRERRLLIWAALTGMALAVLALAFIRPIQWAEHAAVEWAAAHPDRVPMAVAVVPIVGALACGLICVLFKVKIRAHGVSSVLYAIHRRRAQLPGALAARTWLGSSAIIASGGSAGPEGPIVTIGATLGSLISRLLRTDPQTAATLVGCGAAAGLAAVFNAPLTGIFFVLEVLLRDFSLRAFTPIAIA